MNVNQKANNYIVREALPSKVLNEILNLAHYTVIFGVKYNDVLTSLKISLIDEALEKYQTKKSAWEALGITRKILEYNLNGNYKET